MIGSSSMLKVQRLRLFVLPGLWLVVLLVLCGIGTVFTGMPSAQAADLHTVDQNCTATAPRLAIGSATVIDGSEVLCSDITSFGGPVVIRGLVQGDVVSFGGNVVIGGTVNGDVKLYGGTITVQKGASINGNIHSCGGNRIDVPASQLN